MSARAAVIAVALACLLAAGALIAGSGGRDDANRETTENDQAFSWPVSGDRSLGTVELAELGESSVSFTAFAKPGAEFVRWAGPGGAVETGSTLTVGLDEGSSWTAIFEPTASEA